MKILVLGAEVGLPYFGPLGLLFEHGTVGSQGLAGDMAGKDAAADPRAKTVEGVGHHLTVAFGDSASLLLEVFLGNILESHGVRLLADAFITQEGAEFVTGEHARIDQAGTAVLQTSEDSFDFLVLGQPFRLAWRDHAFVPVGLQLPALGDTADFDTGGDIPHPIVVAHADGNGHFCPFF